MNSNQLQVLSSLKLSYKDGRAIYSVADIIMFATTATDGIHRDIVSYRITSI